MWNVAIVTGEADCRAALLAGCAQYAGEAGIRLAADCFADGEQFVQRDLPCDVALLDLDAPFSRVALRALAGRPFVLLSAREEAAEGGYAAGALAFLTKPVEYASLSAALAKAGRCLHLRRERRVLLHAEGAVCCVPAAKIVYVRVRGHHLAYHRAEGDILVRGRLQDAAAALAGAPFVCCSRGVLVNLDYVDEVGKDFLRAGGEVLPLSRLRRRALLQALAARLGEPAAAANASPAPAEAAPVPPAAEGEGMPGQGVRHG